VLELTNRGMKVGAEKVFDLAYKESWNSSP